MAITNSISTLFPTLGHPFLGGVGASSWQSVGNALTNGANAAVTLTFPSSVTLTRGRWRIKLYNQSAAHVPTFIVKAYFSDGTSTLDVLLPLAAFTCTNASAAGSGIELSGMFILDINATTFSVVVTLAGDASETASLDLEVFGIQ
jgi:hypothetical protein